MNIYHRWYCGSGRWRKRAQESLLPGLTKGVEFGDHALEIGPGRGVTTEWLRSHVPALTAIEIDQRLAEGLRQKFDGSNVSIVEGNASRMEFEDASFSAAFSFAMLHHVPTEAQDRLFGEVARVLKPGSQFVGMDSIPSFRWNLVHLFDDRYPVDPETFPARLESAGFSDVKVRVSGDGFAFRAVKG
jgi:ubiquinone/menaquinone biosynthesis C-methylase UbiE